MARKLSWETWVDGGFDQDASGSYTNQSQVHMFVCMHARMSLKSLVCHRDTSCMLSA